MAWTAPVDHAAAVVTVNEWNAQMGATGNMAYLKAAVDAGCVTNGNTHDHSGGDGNPIMRAQKAAGGVVGSRTSINFIEGANVTLTVADNAGADRIDVTVAAAGATVTVQRGTTALATASATATANITAISSLAKAFLVFTWRQTSGSFQSVSGQITNTTTLTFTHTTAVGDTQVEWQVIEFS
jgi:hypothetical protein